MRVIHLALTASSCSAPMCKRPTRKIYESPDHWRGRACCLGHANLAWKKAIAGKVGKGREGAGR